VFIKKNRRGRADGPTHFGGIGVNGAGGGGRWVPTEYNGLTADGHRTSFSERDMIRFDINGDDYYADGGRLWVFLLSLGIRDGEPRDWVRDDKVKDWIKANGIKKIRT
jgi:hypothetical protein